jgi:hypothetical protein
MPTFEGGVLLSSFSAPRRLVYVIDRDSEHVPRYALVILLSAPAAHQTYIIRFHLYEHRNVSTRTSLLFKMSVIYGSALFHSIPRSTLPGMPRLWPLPTDSLLPTKTSVRIVHFCSTATMLISFLRQ